MPAPVAKNARYELSVWQNGGESDWRFSAWDGPVCIAVGRCPEKSAAKIAAETAIREEYKAALLEAGATFED